MTSRSFLKDVASYAGVDFTFRIAQFIVLPIYAHQVSVGDFGILALVQVSAVLLGLAINLGVNNAVQRYYYDPATDPAERPRLISNGLYQLVASGSLVVGTAALLLQAFQAPIEQDFGIGWPLVALALVAILPDQVAQYTLDTVRLHFSPGRFWIISVLKNLIGLLLGLWFLLSWDAGIAGILLGALLGSVIAAPTGLYLIRRDLGHRLEIAAMRRLLRFGTPFVLAGAAYWLFGSMDRWMLMALSGPEQVGLFNMGIKFAGLLAFMMTAFGQAWSPYAYRLRTTDENYRHMYSRIFSIWFLFLALAALGLALFAREAITLLTPSAYWGSTVVMSVGAAGIALYGTTLVTAIGVSIAERPMLLTYSAWLAAATNVSANLLLIPPLGAAGAAIATFVSFGVLASSLAIWSQRLSPIPLEYRKLAYCLAIVVLTLVAPPLLDTIPIGPTLAVGKLALVVVAAGGALAVGFVDPASLRIARTFVFASRA